MGAFVLTDVSGQSSDNSSGARVMIFPPPDPCNDPCVLRFYLPEADKNTELRMVNNVNDVVQTIPISGVLGMQRVTIDMSTLPTGTYVGQLFYKGALAKSQLICKRSESKDNRWYNFDSVSLLNKLAEFEVKLKKLDLISAEQSDNNVAQDTFITSNARVTDSLQTKIRALSKQVIFLKLKLESFEQLTRELALMKATKKNLENPIKQGALYYLTRLYFESSSADFGPRSKVELDDLVDVMKEFPMLEINIMGHTDDEGDYENNMELSRKRAMMVYNYLINNGIAAGRLTYQGFGRNRPLTENLNEEERAINRRVEFLITKK